MSLEELIWNSLPSIAIGIVIANQLIPSIILPIEFGRRLKINLIKTIKLDQFTELPKQRILSNSSKTSSRLEWEICVN